jgi:acetoin utilization protein AcuB
MLVRHRMSHRVVTADADAPATDAARLLARHRIRQLPVVRNGHVVGIITERDLRGRKPLTQPVAALMTAKPFTIVPDAAVDEAARMLRRYKIGGLPVLEGKRLVGIITISDVLDALVALSGVAEPTYRLAVADPRGHRSETRARQAVERGRGELRWLHRTPRARPPELHLRVKAKRIDDVVVALEGEGFEVTRVVAAPRS